MRKNIHINLWEPANSLFQDDPFSWQIRKRLKEKRNTMTASLGRVRSGKSATQIVIGSTNDMNCMDDPYHFTAEDHIAFTPDIYLEKLTHSKTGCYVVFDEPGATWSGRRFMSIQNQLVSATLITFGSRLVNTGWAVPVLKMQDITGARMMNYHFEMEVGSKRGVARFYTDWVSDYSAKTGRAMLGRVFFNKPFAHDPEQLVKYEQMKKDFQDTQYDEAYVRFAEEGSKALQAKKGITPQRYDEILKQILDKPDDFIMNGRIKAELIQDAFSSDDLKGTEVNRFKIVAEKRLETKLAKERQKSDSSTVT